MVTATYATIEYVSSTHQISSSDLLFTQRLLHRVKRSKGCSKGPPITNVLCSKAN